MKQDYKENGRCVRRRTRATREPEGTSMNGMDRRQFGAALLAGALPKRAGLTLGFSTYGMPKLKTEEALAVLARIGFDSVELCALPDRDTAPIRLAPAKRRALRQQLRDRRLKVTALMEHLV